MRLTKPGLDVSCFDVLSTYVNYLCQFRHPVSEHLNYFILRNRVQDIVDIPEELFFRRPMTFRKPPFQSNKKKKKKQKQIEVIWSQIWWVGRMSKPNEFLTINRFDWRLWDVRCEVWDRTLSRCNQYRLLSENFHVLLIFFMNSLIISSMKYVVSKR
jgi:hypothetical protein